LDHIKQLVNNNDDHLACEISFIVRFGVKLSVFAVNLSLDIIFYDAVCFLWQIIYENPQKLLKTRK